MSLCVQLGIRQIKMIKIFIGTSLEEMVQNGQLSENNWKSEYFSSIKEQKEMTSLKKEITWLNEVDSTALAK